MTNYRNPPDREGDKNSEGEDKVIFPDSQRYNIGQSSSNGTLPHKKPIKPVGKFVRSDLGVTLRHEKQIYPTNLRSSIDQFSSSGTLPEEEPQFGQEERAKVLKKKYDKSKKLNSQEGLDPLSEIDADSMKKPKP